MERTTGNGREVSDDGVTWLLVEPSQAWLDARAAADANQPAPEPTAEERLATLIAALGDAQSLEEIRDAAAAAGGN